MADLKINGVLASVYGLVVGEVTGWLHAPPQQTQSVVIPGRAGETELAPTQAGSRSILVRGYVRGSSPSDVRSKFDVLKLATRGLVRLSVPDGLARHIDARCDTFDPPAVSGQFARKDLQVDIRFTARRPYFYDDTPQSIADNVALPLGTAPVRPVITATGITGPGVTLTILDSDDATVGTMVFGTLIITSGDVLVVDCENMTAKLDGVNCLADLTAGDFFELDPAAIADFGTADWPKIQVSGGSATIAYSKAWL